MRHSVIIFLPLSREFADEHLMVSAYHDPKRLKIYKHFCQNMALHVENAISVFYLWQHTNIVSILWAYYRPCLTKRIYILISDQLADNLIIMTYLYLINIIIILLLLYDNFNDIFDANNLNYNLYLIILVFIRIQQKDDYGYFNS